ncbi:MAG: vanadium-dependent haloperoxidase [Bacteroidales bacterium]|nr:vanadium-dependent haloperoxidase [Bacteroidales bacterium]
MIPSGPGYYEPTPPAFIPPIHPYMGNCRTFVKGSIDNTIPPPPIAFSEDRQSPFFAMVDEVYRVSQQNDDEKVATALFWDDFPNGKTLTGGGHWESILKNVMTQLNMSFIEGARVYAELFITMQDAAIGCFKAKYTYNLLRPITYIHKYMHQPDWHSLIVTPPHPEYPAAHATVSMAGATILTSILGNKVSFTDDTYAYRGYKPHHFNNFTEAGREAGMSRLYGGIHYLPSIEAGYKQGENIAVNIGSKLVFKN